MNSAFGVCCRTAGRSAVWKLGGSLTVQLVLPVKVRRRPGAALRIQKATERVTGKILCFARQEASLALNLGWMLILRVMVEF